MYIFIAISSNEPSEVKIVDMILDANKQIKPPNTFHYISKALLQITTLPLLSETSLTAVYNGLVFVSKSGPFKQHTDTLINSN